MNAGGRVLVLGLPPGRAAALEGELGRRGLEVESLLGHGAAVFRAGWDPPALVVVDAADRSALTAAALEALTELGPIPVLAVDGSRPADAIAQAVLEALSLPGTGTRRPRVLVVDDDDDLRGLLELELRTSGFEVAQAIDGVEALAALDRFQPDVILLDLMLPRMSGTEVLAALEQRGGRQPRVVVYSALAEPRVPDALVRRTLRKPADLEVLVEALRTSAAAAP